LNSSCVSYHDKSNTLAVGQLGKATTTDEAMDQSQAAAPQPTVLNVAVQFRERRDQK